MILPPRVLFVGAHCDDIELLAGGLLSLAARACARVGLLVFSDHRGVLDEPLARQAHAEFQANVAALSHGARAEITDHTTFLLSACRGEFQSERGRLYAALEALRDGYDCVVTHDPHDTNQDHQQVAQEVVRVFKAHATVLGGEFPNNDVGGFQPAVWVALSEADAEVKVALVGRYRSQDFGGRPYLDASATRALLRVRGAQIRESSAEAFSLPARAILRPG